MTLGQGAAISLSRKQKTNARNSTEAELIGVYDALPSILHTRYFLEAMGYNVKHNVIYQDNKSSITLERNGRTSASKRTKHIKIRYFFIKDMIAQQEVEVQHCPTKEMWSDILTKPKQGREFFLMRSKLLGCGPTRTEAEVDSGDMRTDKDSVTCQDKPLLSPQGCVGPEVLKVRTRKPKLHVEGRMLLSRAKLDEPGRRVFVARGRRPALACE